MESLQSEKIELYLNSSWVDITPYVIEDIESEWGIDGNSFVDRVASTGDFTIKLNNKNGLFTIGLSSALSGLNTKVPIRYSVVYDGITFVKFFGLVEDINPVDGKYDNWKSTLTAVDWFDELARFKMGSYSLETNKRIDEAVQLILDGMNRQPSGTLLSIGDNTFKTVFDNLSDNTRGLSELARLTLSELGWSYLRRDRINGELFVVESRTERDSKDRSNVPLLKSQSPNLKLSVTDVLKLQNGSLLILNKSAPFTFDDSFTDADVKYGQNIINELTTVSYPRRLDSSVQTLYETPERIALGAGQTKSNLKVSYKDPNGGDVEVNANPLDMVTPTLSDYSMTLNSDGTGTDLTANLLLTVEFFGNGAVYSIQNTGATPGYVWLRFRGKGIYNQNPVRYILSDVASQELYDVRTLDIPQQYQNDPSISEGIANFALNSRSTPRQDLNKISFIANYSIETMQAFLYFDIGNKVYIKSSKFAIDADYFIQKIKYRITDAGIIYVDFFVTDSISVESTPAYLGVDGSSELNETFYIGF